MKQIPLIIFSILLTAAFPSSAQTKVQSSSTPSQLSSPSNWPSVIAQDPGEIEYQIIRSVDLGLPSGTLWGDRNVGAEAPEQHGYHLAWGELQQKEYYEIENYFDSDYSIYNITTGLAELRTEDDAACFYCGSEWRTPSVEQFEELRAHCTWNWVYRNGQPGCEVIGPNGNSIFLPDADTFSDPRYPTQAACFVNYWTRSLHIDSSENAYNVAFNLTFWSELDGDAGTDVEPGIGGCRRSACQAIRPVMETGTSEPDDDPDIPIAVDTFLLDFRDMIVGEEKTLTLTIANVSSQQQVLSGINAQELADEGFSIDWTGGEIAPHTSIAVHITYKATTFVEAKSVLLPIGSKAMEEEGNSIIVMLWVSANEYEAPETPVTVSVDSLDFGEVIIDERKTLALAITNVSDEEQTISEISSDDCFTLDWTGGTLEPGESRAIHVIYTPTAIGTHSSSTLAIGTDAMEADGLALHVSLKGTAIEDKHGGQCTKTYLVLWNKDGSHMTFTLAEKPHIAFADEVMHITTSRMVYDYTMNDLQCMTYEKELPDGIRTIECPDVPFNNDGEMLTFFPASENLHIKIISTNGKVLRHILVEKDKPTSIPLSLLGSGVFILDVNGETYKMLLR